MNKTIDKKENCPVCGAGISRVCLKCSGGGNVDSVFKGAAHADLPTGYTIIASNGLILDADAATAALFGTKRIAMVEKPFTLFIDGENLADFFIHRNALFASRKEQNFEIKLRKKDRSIFHARLKCTFIRSWKKNPACMQIALSDYTEHRRQLDQLGQKLDIENLTRAIATHLIRSPAREIDATLTKELKTLAMFTEVERTYLCIIDENATHLSITHEWCAPQIIPIRKTMNTIMLNRLPGLTHTISGGKLLQVKDVEAESGPWQSDLNRFHMIDLKSFGYFVLQGDRGRTGIIGYDAQDYQCDWDPEIIHLFQFAGHAFLNAIVRKQNEEAWLKLHDQALKPPMISSGVSSGRSAIQSGTNTGKAVTPQPIQTPQTNWVPQGLEEIAEPESGKDLGNIDARSQKEAAAWQYEKADSAGQLPNIMKIPTIDGKMVITCPHCMRQDRISPKRFNAIGKTVSVTCPCHFQFNVTPETRAYYRKNVDLEGVFLRIKSGNIMSDSVGHSGKIRITNISKKGIGFLMEGQSILRTGDQIRTKFTLDNHARSAVTKRVLIKGVNDHYAGGQFLGSDKNDITLGFYMM